MIDLVRFLTYRNVYMPYGTFSRVDRSIEWIIFIVMRNAYSLYTLSLMIDLIRFLTYRNIWDSTFLRVGRQMEWIIFIVMSNAYSLYVLLRLTF